MAVRAALDPRLDNGFFGSTEDPEWLDESRSIFGCRNLHRYCPSLSCHDAPVPVPSLSWQQI